ncbi:MAG: nucleotidyltransferase family protein [Candidatus Cloacimonetes bacterium]|nr:nucleotidyltransferase family protein [Candidatus Cloacimonadota bacterium]MCF7814273.1 nucleotidyltransferase family protein [Candidatus Cloacimonadota bacterium]MCF7868934.1 nucleotidyltransferase family protein [Candidatus Cloacimonadota bacterium]MCF7884314.1 nucleotidyltransferase family protein [Candidatus Cloacimonadota bacterium]
MFEIDTIIGKKKLIEFCKKNKIRKLSLFGSALRDELTNESDIDILVEFEHNHIPGLLKLASMENDLTEFIGRKVDLRTPAELSRYFRNEILLNAKNLYVASR